MNDDIEILKFLIDNGADIRAYNDKALRFAIDYEHFNIVKILIDNGADIFSVLKNENFIDYIHFKINRMVKSLLLSNLEYFKNHESTIEIINYYNLHEFYKNLIN